jgi:uncharacterized protein GlcG (DUF336 family)
MPIAPGNISYRNGQGVPDGWLVLPHDSPLGTISKADVQQIIEQSIAQAGQTRAAIRMLGSVAHMVFAVSDTDGNLLGLYRIPDAAVFSIDVAVAKSRNTAYYADPTALQPIDRVDDSRDGTPDVPLGVAFTNRTFRYLAEPRFPTGIDGTLPPAFSILRDPGIDSSTGYNSGAPLPASAYSYSGPPSAANYTSVLAFDAFNPGRNFRDPDNIANQNGVVFFPGSAPLYLHGVLVGGFGVSGDGVDQDDVVTAAGDVGFGVPGGVLRADDVFVRGTRLPYQKFDRNPQGGT